mmetsp:Transcript_62641/g.183200  ORF Transcript_62641/g.183200 Transcript_62641/m.183200 type:complete len:233 (-) Transcript_62641:197-895(-)
MPRRPTGKTSPRRRSSSSLSSLLLRQGLASHSTTRRLTNISTARSRCSPDRNGKGQHLRGKIWRVECGGSAGLRANPCMRVTFKPSRSRSRTSQQLRTMHRYHLRGSPRTRATTRRSPCRWTLDPLHSHGLSCPSTARPPTCTTTARRRCLRDRAGPGPHRRCRADRRGPSMGPVPTAATTSRRQPKPQRLHRREGRDTLHQRLVRRRSLVTLPRPTVSTSLPRSRLCVPLY